MAQDILVVRLRPYNPRAGNKMRTYTIRGIKFQEHRGWYKVPATLGTYLRSVQQRYGDPHSPPAFDVATPDVALDIQEDERKAVERARAEEARDVTTAVDRSALTTKDLPQLGVDPDASPPPVAATAPTRSTRPVARRGGRQPSGSA